MLKLCLFWFTFKFFVVCFRSAKVDNFVWNNQVNAQEAVDVVSRNKGSMESCKKLIDISSSRGNIDDITVMVINLDKFVPKSH